MARGPKKSPSVQASRQISPIHSERSGSLASELARRLKASQAALQPKSGVKIVGQQQ
jgi:hypothetical protein